jgi:protein-S-isoprenylcysteine O-methyltransferase Ste14
MWLFIKVALFTLAAPGTFGIFLPRYLASQAGDVPASGALRWIAVLSLASGAACYLWCAWDFATVGRGTPLPIDAPRVLVVRGLYRYVRNPMYVGVLLMAIGWMLYFASATLAWYVLVLASCFHLFVLLVEEPVLRRQFGDSYLTFCRQVRRWAPRWPSHLPG